MDSREQRFRVAVIYDVVLTGLPTALSSVPLNFTGWLTCASTNVDAITLTTPIGSGYRIAYQSDWFENVDLNTILASGDGQTICISGVQ